MLKLFQQSASVFGGVFIDKAKQGISFPSRNLSGIDRISVNQRDAFIGASGMPHTMIFGESPSGLGATGESEERSWAHEVGKFQKSKWYKKLRKVYRLLLIAKEGPTKGKVPQDWSIKFLSLIQLSEEEEIQNRSTQSQTDLGYVDRGILAPEEVRKSRFGGAEYTHETTLDQEAYQKYKEELNPHQQGNGFDPFGSDFGFDDQLAKTDSARRIKRIIQLQGLPIAIEHEVGENRFQGAKPLTCAYGHIRGSYGDALDGMSLDVYVGNHYDNPQIYKIRQLIPETGEVDEDKYFLAMRDLDQARKTFLATAGRSRFGGIEIVGNELDHYRVSVNQDAKPPDPTVALTNKAIIDGTDIVNDWLQDIEQWMKEKQSFEAVQQGKAELYDLLDGDRFTKLIAETNTIADLSGREEAQDEAEA